MALKQDGVYFVLCPKEGHKIEGVVPNRVRIIEIFSSKQGQGFMTSAAHLYPNIGRVTPPPPREGGTRLMSLARMFRVLKRKLRLCWSFTTVFAFVFVVVTALLNHLALWALRYFASTRLSVACQILP